MEFEDTTVERITSPTQRGLASHWDSIAGDRPFPDFFEFKPPEHLHDAQQTVIWRVERRNNQHRFRALYQGGKISEAVSFSWTGKTMDEVVPAFLRDIALDAANECASAGCAVYNVFSTWDARGRRVDCERLLLPFGAPGVGVEQVMASLQLTSPEGEVDRRNIIERFELRVETLFCGRIRSSFAREKLGVALPAAVA
jgi:hypothetical protein